MTATLIVECCAETELLHCHGTCVLHVDGSAECTELGCLAPPDGHASVITCAELEGPCCWLP